MRNYIYEFWDRYDNSMNSHQRFFWFLIFFAFPYGIISHFTSFPIGLGYGLLLIITRQLAHWRRKRATV